MGRVTKPDTPEWNFSDPAQVRRLLAYLDGLLRQAKVARDQGKPDHVYRFELTRVRDWASASQRGYLWAVVYPHAAMGLRETFGEDTADSWRAHEFFKQELLARVIVNKTDRPVTSPNGRLIGVGEVVGTWVPSLADLDTHDMTVYIDGVIEYCAKAFGIAVPPPTRKFEDPQLDRPPHEGETVDVGPGRFQIQPPAGHLPPRAEGARRRLPPGVVSGPAREDGGAPMDPDDLDREAERLAGTPGEFR